MTDNNINPVVARAVEHFAGQERFEAVVPEWGEEDEPLVLYAEPLSMADARRIRKTNPNDPFGATCDLVISKAEDADGKRVFTKRDKPYFLNKMDPAVINRVANDLTGGLELGEMDAGIDDAGKD